jgi:hypothetical protein
VWLPKEQFTTVEKSAPVGTNYVALSTGGRKFNMRG